MSDKAKAILILLPVLLGIAASIKPVCVWAEQAYMRGEQQRVAADQQTMRDKMRQYEHQKMR